MNTKNNAIWRANERIIVDATVDLMRENGSKTPTVTAICERAHINRSTFYAHFDNVSDLVVKHGRSLAVSRRRANVPAGSTLTFRESVVSQLENIKENADFYREAGHQYGNVLSRVDDALAEAIIQETIVPAALGLGLTSKEEIELFGLFIGGGFRRVLSTWLSSGCEADIDTVANVLEKCLVSIFPPE